MDSSGYDGIELITTKLFELKHLLKEQDYIEMMNACKEIANIRPPKIAHRVYCTINSLYKNNMEPCQKRTSFYIRVFLNREVDHLAQGDEGPIYLKHVLKDAGCNLADIFQMWDVSHYYSKHIKKISEMILDRDLLETIVIGKTVLEFNLCRKEKPDELAEMPLGVEYLFDSDSD
mgnify:CR=1 FL=1